MYNEYFDFVEKILVKFPKADFLLLGDYNLPSSIVCNAELYFNDKLSYLNFFQYNHICNVKNVILDYVISNSLNINVILDNCPIIPVDLYHPPLSIVYNLKKCCNLKFDDFVFNWNSGDYLSIISYLGSINWSTFFNSNSNINENLDTFYYHIDYAINNYIPKSRRHKLCFPIWFSNELITKIKEKKKLIPLLRF